MTPPPLVSVVMPSMNQAGFIEASIRSVLDQDYHRTEVVVADGGSTDGTLATLDRLSAKYSGLRWSSRVDSGPASAINRAISSARGSIIGWLNSDDLYTAGAVKRAVQAFSDAPSQLMVYGWGEHIDENGSFIESYPTSRPPVTIEQFSKGCFICQPTVFFKAVVPTLLGPLDESLKASFDFDYWMRAFAAFGERIGFVDAGQARSRLHESCITQTQRGTVALEGLRVTAAHLGHADPHWIITYLEQSSASTAGSGGTLPQSEVDKILSKAAEILAPHIIKDLQSSLSRKIIYDSAVNSCDAF